MSHAFITYEKRLLGCENVSILAYAQKVLSWFPLVDQLRTKGQEFFVKQKVTVF